MCKAVACVLRGVWQIAVKEGIRNCNGDKLEADQSQQALDCISSVEN
jgi:hypothetical protein